MTIKLVTDKFLFLPRQILHDKRVKNSYTKLVYVALVDAIDSRNAKSEELCDTANVSQAALAEMTSLSKPTVKKAIDELESLGYVEILEDEVGFKKIYKVNREPMEIELSPTDTLMTVCKKGLKADCKKYGIEIENGDTVKMHWYKDIDGKYPVIDEKFLAEKFSSAPQPSKIEDTPADTVQDKVENSPVVEKPARKRVKLLAVKKTSNAEVKPARKIKLKVNPAPVKTSNTAQVKTSNVETPVKTSNESAQVKTSNGLKRLNFSQVSYQVLRNFRDIKAGRSVSFPEFEEEARKYVAEGYV